jgi:transforming growth factor-beta-induced protein
VPGKFFSGNLIDGQTFTTLFGEKLNVQVEDGQIYIDGALITTADIPAKNGVIHIVIDWVFVS